MLKRRGVAGNVFISRPRSEASRHCRESLMFAAPERISAKVFARIPEKLGIKDRKSIWVDTQMHGAPTPTFLEGPSFDRDGNLFVVDIPWGRIFKITPAGEVSVAAEYDGEPNGLKFHRDGRAFIADHRNGIMVFDPRSGKVEPYFDRPMLQRFKGTNDLVFASNGDIYSPTRGRAACTIRPAGSIGCARMASSTAFSTTCPAPTGSC